MCKRYRRSDVGCVGWRYISIFCQNSRMFRRMPYRRSIRAVRRDDWVGNVRLPKADLGDSRISRNWSVYQKNPSCRFAGPIHKVSTQSRNIVRTERNGKIEIQVSNERHYFIVCMHTCNFDYQSATESLISYFASCFFLPECNDVLDIFWFCNKKCMIK
jgi:hypothetical protein